MIAKVMTVGRDRRAALRRMRRALAEVVVSGIQTTLPFDLALLDDPAFAEADGSLLSTDWVAERWDGAADRERVAQVAAIAAVAAATGPDAPLSLRKDDQPPNTIRAWRAAGRATAVDRWPR